MTTHMLNLDVAGCVACEFRRLNRVISAAHDNLVSLAYMGSIYQ